MSEPTLSVAIITYERPDFVRRCLGSLEGERSEILDVVVVDASAGLDVDLARQEGVTYVHAPELAGWMTKSRNRALLHTQGDVVAFLDDDVVVRPGWARTLRGVYSRHPVDAVVGRTCNGLPGEERYDLPVGRLLDDGILTEGFASEVGQVKEVDHGIGANMSFTREVLWLLGGFRDDYPGTALREDTDMFLRVKKIGKRAVFASATVDHLPAAHVRGQRFDTRYKLYARRNHMVLLSRHHGVVSPALRKWIVGQLRTVSHPEGMRRKAERFAAVAVGVGFGVFALLRERRISPMQPQREGVDAERVRQALARATRNPPRARDH